MSWYRFHCDSGPGHQSSHETYRWIDVDLTSNDLEGEWQDWVRNNFWNDAIGGVRKVKSLPEEWRTRLISKHKNTISNSRKMLTILKETPDAKKKAAKK